MNCDLPLRLGYECAIMLASFGTKDFGGGASPSHPTGGDSSPPFFFFALDARGVKMV